MESDQTLIALKDGDGKTALHHAAGAGKAAAVEFLLGRGASVSGVDAQPQTPLHAAARGGSVAVGRRLAAKGAPIDAKNEYGVTPLYIAAENGRTGFVEFLLDGGAKVGEPSRTGKTAWHIAGESGCSALADLLRARGASAAPPRFPELRGPYLDEPEPGDLPARFLLGIVSGHGFDNEHSPAVFSPDGNAVFWGSGFGKGILMMTRETGLWTAPRQAPFVSQYGDGDLVLEPGFSDLGHAT